MHPDRVLSLPLVMLPCPTLITAAEAGSDSVGCWLLELATLGYYVFACVPSVCDPLSTAVDTPETSTRSLPIREWQIAAT